MLLPFPPSPGHLCRQSALRVELGEDCASLLQTGLQTEHVVGMDPKLAAGAGDLCVSSLGQTNPGSGALGT